MSIVQLTMGLVALATTFALIRGATLLLTPCNIWLVCRSCSVWRGRPSGWSRVLMLSTGLTALAVAGTSLSVGLVAIITSLVGLIPFVFKTLGQGITEFVKQLATNSSEISNAMVTILLSMIQALTRLIPALLGMAGKLITSILVLILKYIKIIHGEMCCCPRNSHQRHRCRV